MAHMEGRRCKLAMIKQTTLGTAVTPNVSGKRIPFEAFTVKEVKAFDGNVTLNGYRYSGKSVKAGSVSQGELTLFFDAVNIDELIAAYFGGVTTPAQQAASTAYLLKYYDLATGLEGIFWTLAADKINKIHVFEGCKVNRFNIRADVVTGKAMATFGILGRSEQLNSGTYQSHAITTLGSATYRDAPEDAKLTAATTTAFQVWLNAQDGDELDANDAVYPNVVELDLRQPYAIDHTTSGGEFPDEFLTDGFGEGTLTLEIPKIDGVGYLESVQGQEIKKAELRFTGAEFDSDDGGYDYYRHIHLPALEPQDPDGFQISGPGKNTQTITYKVIVPDDEAAPTGMDYATPYVESLNTRSTSPLA